MLTPGGDTAWTLHTLFFACFSEHINRFNELFNIYKGRIPKTDNNGKYSTI